MANPEIDHWLQGRQSERCDNSQIVRPERVTALIREVAEKHGVHPREIIGPSRKRAPSFARFEVAWRLRNPYLGAPPSLPTIARWLGGRDHTSILHAVRRWEELSSPAERGDAG